MKFIACKSKRDFVNAAGFDWTKIVKVEGGYIGFSTVAEYGAWKAQK